VGKLLHRLRMTRLQPRPYHPKKDAAAQETFKKPSRIEFPPVAQKRLGVILVPEGGSGR